MSILNIEDIRKRLDYTKSSRKRLIVTPILDRKNQINSPGIDLRLSNQFIVFKLENIAYLDVRHLSNFELLKFQRHIVVPFDGKFILHPKTLVLGSTFEYISMPEDLEGSLEGRSSWARLGLIIATACIIDPLFKGCVTLELTNLGNEPIILYPGIRMAKLILTETKTPSKSYNRRTRKYYCQIGPEFSKAHNDRDLFIFNKKT